MLSLLTPPQSFILGLDVGSTLSFIWTFWLVGGWRWHHLSILSSPVQVSTFHLPVDFSNSFRCVSSSGSTVLSHALVIWQCLNFLHIMDHDWSVVSEARRRSASCNPPNVDHTLISLSPGLIPRLLPCLACCLSHVSICTFANCQCCTACLPLKSPRQVSARFYIHLPLVFFTCVRHWRVRRDNIRVCAFLALICNPIILPGIQWSTHTTCDPVNFGRHCDRIGHPSLASDTCGSGENLQRSFVHSLVMSSIVPCVHHIWTCLSATISDISLRLSLIRNRLQDYQFVLAHLPLRFFLFRSLLSSDPTTSHVPLIWHPAYRGAPLARRASLAAQGSLDISFPF